MSSVFVTLALLTASIPANGSANSDPCEKENLRSNLDSLALPYCRAYEMVSPPYKEGYIVTVASYAPTGDKAILSTIGNVANTAGAGESASEGELYADERTQAGWRVSSLNPSSTEFAGQVPVAAEAQSGLTLWKQHTLQQSVFRVDLYIRSPAGVFGFIGPLSLPREGVEEPSDVMDLSQRKYDRPIASTSDYRHVVLSAISPEDYWPFDETQGILGSLYEYSGVNNQQPILVGVNGDKGSTKLVGLCGTELGGLGGGAGSSYNAISNDGETIFFTVFSSRCGAEAPETIEIYARRYGSLLSPYPAESVDVSASECTVSCGVASGKNFEGASEDGKMVFFTSTQKLTNDAVDGTASGDATNEEGGCSGLPATGGCNLYEYNFQVPGHGQHLRLVAGGEVLGVAGIAEDGAHVYFVSRDAIPTAGSNMYGVAPIEKQPNLYAYDTNTGRTTFIVSLTGSEDYGDWIRTFRTRSTQVGGAHGRFLLFLSAAAHLTPDDNSEQVQLFEYQAEGEEGQPAELVRVTKGEDGFNEEGNGVTSGITPSTLYTGSESLGNGTDFKSTTNRLNVASDGKTVFFLATGALSQRAVSAASGCRNLYEFHATEKLSEGTVHLISDGRDTQLFKGAFCGPQFQGIDAIGANVMFTATDPLLPSDVDGGQRDIYDARINGGFAIQSEGEGGLCSICEAPPVAAGGRGLATVGSIRNPGEASLAQAVKTSNRSSVNKQRGVGGRLAKARRVCRHKPKARRAACERVARRKLASKAITAKPLRKG